MKIIEVRDGFIKFEADESIYLSSFIKVDGEDKSYLAQVIQQKDNISFAKILFLLSGGELLNYDKTLPSIDSEITDYTSEIIDTTIKYEQPVIVGKTETDKNLVVDLSAFNKKTIISIDDKESNNILIKNLVKQFANAGKKTVIIDTLGNINSEKYTAGTDFKLPLDKTSLEFMYKECLGDATADSKSTIIDIFRELAEYSETVPFVPFSILQSIVNNMVEKEHVFKLLVLKNKLTKFAKLGYFASNKKEVDTLSQILNSKTAVIDLSKVDTLFQNRFLAYLYDSIQENDNIQIILELSNTISKKNLKKVLTSNVPTAFITHSKFSYLNDIKNFFDNFIVVPSVANNQIFRIYATFLKALKSDSFLIVGEATNYIPFVSKIIPIDETLSNSSAETIKAEDLEDIIHEDISNVETGDSSDNYIETIRQNQPAEDKVIEAIDEKSNSAIAEITENLEMPDEIEMFAENDIENDENIDFEEEKENNEQETAENENISEELTEELIIEPEVKEIELTEEKNELEEELSQETIDTIEEHEDNVEIIPYENIENENFDEDIQLKTDIENIQGVNQGVNQGVQEESQEEAQELVIDDSDIDVLTEDIEPSDIQKETSIPEDAETELPLEETVEEAIPINNDNLDFEEIVELDPAETDASDIIVDMEDGFSDSYDEDKAEEIAKDVDKVFTTRQDNEEFSDSDLDFIDELNNDDSELIKEAENDEVLLEELIGNDDDEILQESSENENLEEIKDYEPEILEKRESSTPIVPVYDADIPQEDMVESDPIEQGDSVVHAKYGIGVVEKMIKYGNKTLYSINFENIGRRLLDPTLTEIKKN